MKKLFIVLCVALIALVSCQTVQLPAPTAEEAKEYEDRIQEVLSSAGFGGIANAISGNSADGEYKAGDKLGIFTVTKDSHVRIEIDLSGMFQGTQSVNYDIDVAYKPLIGDERSLVYVAKTGVEDGNNVTTILKCEMDGKAFDPAAMQALLAE